MTKNCSHVSVTMTEMIIKSQQMFCLMLAEYPRHKLKLNRHILGTPETYLVERGRIGPL